MLEFTESFQASDDQAKTELHCELSCKTVLLIKNQIINYRASYPPDFAQSMIRLILKIHVRIIFHS